MRRTHLSHLPWVQKLAHIDVVGCFTLGAGLCLMLTGLGLGGGLYAWSNVRVLATLIIGIVVLVAFGLYEWKGTKIGVLDHEMFRHGIASRTFALCLPVAAIEGFVVYSYLVFAPVLTSAVFTTDPLLISARTATYYIAVLPGTLLFGYISTKMRSVREVLIVAFIINLGGLIGFTTIQPGQSALPIAMGALQGFGFGGLLSQIIAAAQVSVPHSYIASASAVAIICRALASTVATSIYSTAVNNRVKQYIPAYVARAAAMEGLPAAQIPAFVAALASGKIDQIPSQATPRIIAAGVVGLKQAYADGLRVVPIIAAPLGVLAIVLCCFMGSLKDNMTYHVDAPVEELHAKEKPHNSESALKA